MTVVRTIIVLFFACISLSSYSQLIASEVYVIDRVYDANGNEIIGGKEKVYTTKIEVDVFSASLLSDAVAYYTECVFGVWKTALYKRFKYAGENNGWNIYRYDMGMWGTSYIYIMTIRM